MSSSMSFIFYINAWLIITDIFLFSGWFLLSGTVVGSCETLPFWVSEWE